MGEMSRLAIIDLHEQGLIFQGQDLTRTRAPYVIDTCLLSQIEDDPSADTHVTRRCFNETLGSQLLDNELLVVKRLAEATVTRGARTCGCGVATICHKQGITLVHIAADGSVANKHSKSKARWAGAMAKVLDCWPQGRTIDPITLTSAEDGSRIGAAIIAAMIDDRAKPGDVVGIRDKKTRRLSKTNVP